ncbi:MAG: transposase [Gammaproteobacteria bacterium]|nr:transposase [Gammaproteobacteria bacterium]
MQFAPAVPAWLAVARRPLEQCSAHQPGCLSIPARYSTTGPTSTALRPCHFGRENRLRTLDLKSFIGELRDQYLNEHWFRNLHHAKNLIPAWRSDYNEQRPYSSIGYLTPAEFSVDQRKHTTNFRNIWTMNNIGTLLRSNSP